MPAPIHISISVVSHGQIDLIHELLLDLSRVYPANEAALEVILTLNLPESLPFSVNDFPFSIKMISNSHPLGFGANHNQAFRHAEGEFFAVVNPDIRLALNPFPALLACLTGAEKIALVAPVVLNPAGQVEDSARKFPTPLRILCKVFGHCRGSDYRLEGAFISPNWVAGMFMLFPRKVFASIQGFDERYFLYYEDVDICARLRLQGYDIRLCPQAMVAHYAQRSSHRQWKYLRWHLRSATRFFLSAAFWQWQWRRCLGRS